MRAARPDICSCCSKDGRKVIKGDSVVAVLTEPGAMLGEMSVLLDQPHTATVRAAADSVVYEFDDAAAFQRDQPAMALSIARLLAQRLNVANTDLADLMHHERSDVERVTGENDDVEFGSCRRQPVELRQ
jgi:CRP-like cAMP-binding protein